MTVHEKSPTVFIAWHAARSREIALALRNWIGMVIQAAEPWMSEHDLNSGVRWSPELAQKLDTCSFGIACLTPENLDSTWIHFESGAIAKSVRDGRLVPYLLDIDKAQVRGPLAEFQMESADRAGTLALVQSLNGFLPTRPLDDSTLKSVFESLWPNLEKELARIRAMKGASAPKRSAEDMLEEILGDVRAMRREDESPALSRLAEQRVRSRATLPTPQKVSLQEIAGNAGISPEAMGAIREAVESNERQRREMIAMIRSAIGEHEGRTKAATDSTTPKK